MPPAQIWQMLPLSSAERKKRAETVILDELYGVILNALESVFYCKCPYCKIKMCLLVNWIIIVFFDGCIIVAHSPLSLFFWFPCVTLFYYVLKTNNSP